MPVATVFAIDAALEAVVVLAHPLPGRWGHGLGGGFNDDKWLRIVDFFVLHKYKFLC